MEEEHKTDKKFIANEILQEFNVPEHKWAPRLEAIE